MSVQVLSVIQDTAAKIGDPAFSQITVAEYLAWANQRARKLCVRMNLVKWVAFADINADDEVYAEPDDCIQLTRLQFSPTPTDPRTFRDLSSYFADEFRARVNWNYPVGDPDSYFADQGFLYLVGRPVADLSQALKIEYWGLPTDMTNAYTDKVPLADTVRDLLADGMEIDALWKLEKRDESLRAAAVWEANIGAIRPKLEMRSTDRRSSVRVSRGGARTWRAV